MGSLHCVLKVYQLLSSKRFKLVWCSSVKSIWCSSWFFSTAFSFWVLLIYSLVVSELMTCLTGFYCWIVYFRKDSWLLYSLNSCMFKYLFLLYWNNILPCCKILDFHLETCRHCCFVFWCWMFLLERWGPSESHPPQPQCKWITLSAWTSAEFFSSSWSSVT